MLDDSKAMDLLKFNYGICMEGYNSRDKLVNDIFFRLIHVFQFFLIIIIITVSLTQSIYPNYHPICCAVIGFTGLLSMVSLLISLESFSSSKASLRDHCKRIDDIIVNLLPVEESLKSSKLLPVNESLKFWHIVGKRQKYLEENFLKEEQKSLFRIWASRIIILIWIGVVIALAIRFPTSEHLSQVEHLLHLGG
jgi:hypothetical protein